jgi:hypothetical protein
MSNSHSPFHPIIYVRGYAMTKSEMDDTAADPFCGFNLGSTVYRATPDKTKPPRKFVFESPVIRLASDFEYSDVYEDGFDITDEDWADGTNKLRSKSIIVYRYYDQASQLIGTGYAPSMPELARGLSTLVSKVRDLICDNAENAVSPEDFRCHLVAHSMGGLVCRAFLQNPKCDPAKVAKYVDKLFTYATPHNGIEVAGFNVPAWLGAMDVNNFSRDEMAKYLDLQAVYAKTGRVDWLPEDRFSIDRVFCMVGTNRADYEAAAGLSRTFVGHGSDGLVKIENATLCAVDKNGSQGRPSAKAFAYRSHSGYFGIVNGEEAYQNLARFLFGDVRVDVWLDIDGVSLPKEVEEDEAAGKQVNALYQIEALASARGKHWYLTRRVVEEDSVACVTHADLKKAPKSGHPLYVSTVFLANRARVNPKRPSLAYSLQVAIKVPDYEVERKLWADKHYEGANLFKDALTVEITPPSTKDGWKLKYAWQRTGMSDADTAVDAVAKKGGRIEVAIPFDSTSKPGAKGRVRLVISAWE